MRHLIGLVILALTGCVYEEQSFNGLDEVVKEQVFSQPLHDLSGEDEKVFLRGQGLFRRSWSPAELGPVFNAVACAECHARDGRANPEGPGLILRLSLGDGTAEPVYGEQFQPRGSNGAPGEGRVETHYTEVEGTYEDGERYSLRRPEYRLTDLAYGQMHAEVQTSPRLAQQIFGLGLLEDVPDEAILKNADPNDDNGDGISGRINLVWDVEHAKISLGRFGWKAGQPSVKQQNAAAFLGDMGMTSELFPSGPCTLLQPACTRAVLKTHLDLEMVDLEHITTYVRLLAPPPPRLTESNTHQRGRRLFEEVKCAACHVPELVPDLAAYTDLLLHDMGEDLADNRKEGEASGREWRTPPLWGIGRLESVNGHTMLMHDGRARGVAEAIMWHGGEAEASREAFRRMPRDDRDALVEFVHAL